MESHQTLSCFELLLVRNSPIFESLLLQLPTQSILQLYHTSRLLRSYIRQSPIAWKHLSFRTPSTVWTASQPSPPGAETSGIQRQSKQYSLDQLLLMVVVPFGSCLTSLELDNTAVGGDLLTTSVLTLRRETLQHLSVRGCKNVSLKYHLVPFLHMFGLTSGIDMSSDTPTSVPGLALRSLYTYRCRHHRRRPYLSSSLLRRDSDSEPTHELVRICHKLGIYTDTAWCTTPGGRCLRRKDYAASRAPQGSGDVWVVYDRLWRSVNFIGPENGVRREKHGRIWEEEEEGFEGEALGVGGSESNREGKDVPAHLRKSHRMFVEDVNCGECGTAITERCEQCSVRMHCMGCRKTLCGSCAFDRPVPKMSPAARASRKEKEDLWWAPGAAWSPNSMQEPSQSNPTAAPNATVINQQPPPKLRQQWCCTEPIFSGGGGIAFVAPIGHNHEVDRVRAAPLPRGQGWEDPEFEVEWIDLKFDESTMMGPEPRTEEGKPLLYYLLGLDQGTSAKSCPRNLCTTCFNSTRWRQTCKTCTKPLCMEHDVRGCRVRVCGYRDLHIEKRELENPPSPRSEAASNSDDDVPDLPDHTSATTDTGSQSLTYTVSTGDTTTAIATAPTTEGPANAASAALSSTLSPDPSDASSEPDFSPRPSSSHESDNPGPQTPSHPRRHKCPTPSNLETIRRARRQKRLGYYSPTPTFNQTILRFMHAQVLDIASETPLPDTNDQDIQSASEVSNENFYWNPPYDRSSSSLFTMAPRRFMNYTSEIPAIYSAPFKTISRPPPLPPHLRKQIPWRGCNSFFCPPARSVSDVRTRCTTISCLRECTTCNIFVCAECLTDNPACSCSYCKEHFNCLNCWRELPDGLCKREEEELARRMENMRDRIRRLEEVVARETQAEIMGFAGEFFHELEDGVCS